MLVRSVVCVIRQMMVPGVTECDIGDMWDMRTLVSETPRPWWKLLSHQPSLPKYSSLALITTWRWDARPWLALETQCWAVIGRERAVTWALVNVISRPLIHISPLLTLTHCSLLTSVRQILRKAKNSLSWVSQVVAYQHLWLSGRIPEILRQKI